MGGRKGVGLQVALLGWLSVRAVQPPQPQAVAGHWMAEGLPVLGQQRGGMLAGRSTPPHATR